MKRSRGEVPRRFPWVPVRYWRHSARNVIVISRRVLYTFTVKVVSKNRNGRSQYEKWTDYI